MSNLLTKDDSNMSDIWDDTELIKMYEDAIKPECKPLAKVQTSDSSSKNWTVGDECGAPYYEDDLYYPAKITSIDYSTGEAEVIFESYENAEVIAVADLCTRAELETAQQESEDSVESVPIQETIPQEGPRCSAKKDRRKNRNNSPRASSSRSNEGATISNPPLLPAFAPPLPPEFSSRVNVPDEAEALSSMMMSWYMSGYHTGYYQCLNDLKKKQEEEDQ